MSEVNWYDSARSLYETTIVSDGFDIDELKGWRFVDANCVDGEYPIWTIVFADPKTNFFRDLIIDLSTREVSLSQKYVEIDDDEYEE